jgi:hypothetical protein
VTIQTWQNVYDYQQQKYIQREGERFTTDNNGMAILATAQKGNYSLELIHGKDTLHTIDETNTHPYYPSQETNTKRTFFFTDRSIYRPGQTIYFKGIIVTTNNKNSNENRLNQ